jgi:hypothetical protein
MVEATSAGCPETLLEEGRGNAGVDTLRRNLIGVALGLVGALALSGVASAAVTGVTWTATATPTKQDKKKRGGVAITLGIAEAHVGLTFPPGGQGCMPPTVVTPACKYDPPSHTSVIHFDPDFKVTPGAIPRCNPASLIGKNATGARAACPRSIVGQGTSEIHTVLETNPLIGTVTAFNGLPSGGNPMVLLHMDLDRSATSPILTGVIRGNVLTVQGPVTPGVALTNLTTTINRLVSLKKGRKRSFFVSARCSKRRWQSSATVFYTDGTQQTGSTTQTCKQKKKQKK